MKTNVCVSTVLAPTTFLVTNASLRTLSSRPLPGPSPKPVPSPSRTLLDLFLDIPSPTGQDFEAAASQLASHPTSQPASTSQHFENIAASKQATHPTGQPARPNQGDKQRACAARAAPRAQAALRHHCQTDAEEALGEAGSQPDRHTIDLLWFFPIYATNVLFQLESVTSCLESTLVSWCCFKQFQSGNLQTPMRKCVSSDHLSTMTSATELRILDSYYNKRNSTSGAQAVLQQLLNTFGAHSHNSLSLALHRGSPPQTKNPNML